MNQVFFIIALADQRRIPIAIDSDKLHGDASVMWEAEQQKILTYDECNTHDWQVYRISPAQYAELMRKVA